MIKKIIIFILFISMLLGDNIKIFDKNLYDYVINWEKQQFSKKEILKFKNNIAVRNCNQYLEAKKKNNILEFNYNYYALSGYLICPLAKELQPKNISIEEDTKSKIDYSKLILNFLNVKLFKSSLRQLISDNKKSKVTLLGDILGKPEVHTNTKLTFIDSTGWERDFNIILVKAYKCKKELYIVFSDISQKSSYVGFSLIKLTIYKNGKLKIDEII